MEKEMEGETDTPTYRDSIGIYSTQNGEPNGKEDVKSTGSYESWGLYKAGKAYGESLELALRHVC